ncbi:uncharacterized protein BDZ99DRAFT_575605 [Mytilinidion resinicola]|uniref:C3H1-type domain-containing protein n=1 Tax=Mytilinidion resinicola TaxID=574789 RepID=A0A6A6Y5J5_9PEZI|nr:uncharacterized protein BDZ99DRAFT_575605 [Mytilinidion resinicola]KAF2803930.1 hypothetical protein BDZ99DRAFT_575605 [Mytilinidion resinicola]
MSLHCDQKRHLAAATDAPYVPLQRPTSDSSDSSELEAGEIRDTPPERLEVKPPWQYGKADSWPHRSADTFRPSSLMERRMEAGGMDGARLSRAPTTGRSDELNSPPLASRFLDRVDLKGLTSPSKIRVPRSEHGRAHLFNATTRHDQVNLEGLTSHSRDKVPPRSYAELDDVPPTKRPRLTFSSQPEHEAITLGENPQTGRPLLYRRDVPLTCFYFMQGSCFRAEENCKYAHWDTGVYSEEPYTEQWKNQMKHVRTAHMKTKRDNEASPFRFSSDRHSHKALPSNPNTKLLSTVRRSGTTSRTHRGRGHRHIEDSPPPLGPPLKATPEASRSQRQNHQVELIHLDNLLAERKTALRALDAANCPQSASILRLQIPVGTAPEHGLTNTEDAGDGKQKEELRKWEQRLRNWEKVLGGREEAVIAEEERLGDWEGLLGCREERLRGRG